MSSSVFAELGQQLRGWRKARKLSQPALAQRLGRDRARISELERDLLGSRWGRDRLTLFAELCDALDLEPVLVPRGQAETVRSMVEGKPSAEYRKPITSTFEELFVDLNDEDEG